MTGLLSSTWDTGGESARAETMANYIANINNVT